jgi:mRNA-degrading endonuclease RelE of RelBE toxin-antitoxin system
MPVLQLFYHPEVVRRDIPRLDPPTRRRIQSAIAQKLTSKPEDFAKPLAYTRAGLWSLRVGSWRVIFTLRGTELWVLRIGHRREVYERLDRDVPPRP